MLVWNAYDTAVDLFSRRRFSSVAIQLEAVCNSTD